MLNKGLVHSKLIKSLTPTSLTVPQLKPTQEPIQAASQTSEVPKNDSLNKPVEKPLQPIAKQPVDGEEDSEPIAVQFAEDDKPKEQKETTEPVALAQKEQEDSEPIEVQFAEDEFDTPEARQYEQDLAQLNAQQVQDELKEEEPLDYSNLENVTLEDYLVKEFKENPEKEKRFKEAVAQYFPEGNLKGIPALLGFGDDVWVTIGDFNFVKLGGTDLTKSSITVEVNHPQLTGCLRTFKMDEYGNKFIKNEELTIKHQYRNSGLGTAIFTAQVEAAAKAGFAYIQTFAEGDVRSSSNGYYTWPLLGYDQNINDRLGSVIEDKIIRIFPDASSVLDVISVEKVELSEEEEQECRNILQKNDKRRGRDPKEYNVISGADWWRAYGCSLYSAKFDLSEGSRSRVRLATYREQKQRGQKWLKTSTLMRMKNITSKNHSKDLDSSSPSQIPAKGFGLVQTKLKSYQTENLKKKQKNMNKSISIRDLSSSKKSISAPSVSSRSPSRAPLEKEKDKSGEIYSWSMSCSECGGYRVRVVSSVDLRNMNLDLEEFGLIAIHEDFPKIIPENEIWVGERLPIGEFHPIIAGTMARLKALKRGFSSDEAYDRGITKDRNERSKSTGYFAGGEWGDSPIIDRTGYCTIKGDGSTKPINVYMVDGGIVRSTYKTDFLEGGNAGVYPWVPQDEIWIESGLDAHEMAVVGLHEYSERLMMLQYGLDYDRAHEIASKIEFSHRPDFSQKDLEQLTPAVLKGFFNPKIVDHPTKKRREGPGEGDEPGASSQPEMIKIKSFKTRTKRLPEEPSRAPLPLAPKLNKKPLGEKPPKVEQPTPIQPDFLEKKASGNSEGAKESDKPTLSSPKPKKEYKEPEFPKDQDLKEEEDLDPDGYLASLEGDAIKLPEEELEEEDDSDRKKEDDSNWEKEGDEWKEGTEYEKKRKSEADPDEIAAFNQQFLEGTFTEEVLNTYEVLYNENVLNEFSRSIGVDSWKDFKAGTIEWLEYGDFQKNFYETIDFYLRKVLEGDPSLSFEEALNETLSQFEPWQSNEYDESENVRNLVQKEARRIYDELKKRKKSLPFKQVKTLPNTAYKGTFTGVLKDKKGRKQCYSAGRHVPCVKQDETSKRGDFPAGAGGEGTSKQDRGNKNRYSYSKSPYQIKFVNARKVRYSSKAMRGFKKMGTCVGFSKVIPPNEIWIAKGLAEEEKALLIKQGEAELNALAQGLSLEEALQEGKKVLLVEKRKQQEASGEVQTQEEVLKGVYIDLLASYEEGYPLQIWLVDGNEVRKQYDKKFYRVGNSYDFPFIPEDEIWIEEDVPENEREALMDGETAKLFELDQTAKKEGGVEEEETVETAEPLPEKKLPSYPSKALEPTTPKAPVLKPSPNADNPTAKAPKEVKQPTEPVKQETPEKPWKSYVESNEEDIGQSEVGRAFREKKDQQRKEREGNKQGQQPKKPLPKPPLPIPEQEEEQEEEQEKQWDIDLNPEDLKMEKEAKETLISALSDLDKQDYQEVRKVLNDYGFTTNATERSNHLADEAMREVGLNPDKIRQQDVFEQSIQEDPLDDATRGIYADWLEENGYEEEALRQRDTVKEIDKTRQYFKDNPPHPETGRILGPSGYPIENGYETMTHLQIDNTPITPAEAANAVRRIVIDKELIGRGGETGDYRERIDYYNTYVVYAQGKYYDLLEIWGNLSGIKDENAREKALAKILEDALANRDNQKSDAKAMSWLTSGAGAELVGSSAEPTLQPNPPLQTHREREEESLLVRTKELTANRLWIYVCPFCKGDAHNGDVEKGTQYRGSAKCQDCNKTFSVVGPNKPKVKSKAGPFLKSDLTEA